jgi:hypothetical protein
MEKHIKVFPSYEIKMEVLVMVFNATFSNISVILWQSVLLVAETRVPREKPPTCRKSLTKLK